MPIVATESDIALRDGSTVHVRPVGPEDVERILCFLSELSDEARSFRFFTGAADLGQMARLFTETRGGTSLLAVTADDGHVVGHGQYFPDGTGGAEVAFAVADHWQGRGIATLLLAQLAEAAAAEDVREFTAAVLTSNRRMIGTFRESGFPVEVCTQPGELQGHLPDQPDRVRPSPVRGARAHGRRGRCGARAAPPVGRHGGRVAATRQHRGGGHGEPGRRRLHGADLRRQPQRHND